MKGDFLMKWKSCLAILLVLSIFPVLPMSHEEAHAAYYPNFSFRVYDYTGSGAVIDGIASEVTGHKLYAYIADLAYAGSKPKIKWSSKSPSIASINSKGVITCKKAGIATISAKITNRSTKLAMTKSFKVGVVGNDSTFTGMPPSYMELARNGNFVIATSHRIYVKGGKVYTQLYVYNGTGKPLKKSINLDMVISYDVSSSSSQLINIGKRKVSLTSPIAPHTVGLSKALNVGKPGGFNSKKDFLLLACVIAASPSNTKSADSVFPLPLLTKSSRHVTPAQMLTQSTRTISRSIGDASPDFQTDYIETTDP